MRKQACLFVVGVGWAVFASASANAQGPLETLKSFGAFQQIEANRLLSGDIFVERGPLMNFPNGISGQTCFAVPLSAEETAKRLQVWDPSPHGDLKVYSFHSLHMPCELTDFQQLDFRSSQRPVRWLVDKTIATTSAKSELNLTRDESRKLASCVQKSSDPQRIDGCWASLLFDRASQFQKKGLSGALPYEMAGESAAAGVQLRTMLFEQPDVVREFSPLLKKVGLYENEATATSLTPFYYWTFFDADHHGTLNLGAVYLLPVNDHYQLADVEYYVSGNYYTSITLYEVWPISGGKKSAALVWRGDYFAAPTLAFTKGTERIAYGALMLQDIKKETRYFQEDLKAPR